MRSRFLNTVKFYSPSHILTFVRHKNMSFRIKMIFTVYLNQILMKNQFLENKTLEVSLRTCF